MRAPLFLASADEFRPGAPPAFGSAQFMAALAEVRQIADTRTAEQLPIATYWNVNPVAPLPGGLHGDRQRADRLLSPERRRSRADHVPHRRGLLRCADRLLRGQVPLLVHPAAAGGCRQRHRLPYTAASIVSSAHSCNWGAIAAVLAAVFPSEATRLAAVAEESSLSRLYAGIHYRFDMEAGLALGRSVAAKALGADLDEVSVP